MLKLISRAFIICSGSLILMLAIAPQSQGLSEATSTTDIAKEKPLLIFAAASLTDVLTDLSDTFAASSKSPDPVLSFGGSATMARQIQAGAPADLFLSANPYWSTYLLTKKLAFATTPVTRNRLVLVQNQGEPFNTLEAVKHFIAGKQIAIADPALAPAGEYAKAFLYKLFGEIDAQQLIMSPNVRQTLRLAEVSGMPAIVYRSDAIASKKVKIAFNIPEHMHAPIMYEAALINNTKAARSFLSFIKTDSAGPIWEKHGFSKLASK